MTRSVDYAALPTEQPNPRSRELDRLSTEQILRLMNQEDARVPAEVARVIPAIARAVSETVGALKAGGRLFFVGAGTSGRLAVIEAAECPPTFGTPPGMVQAIIAGGRSAVFRSREGAEDDHAAAQREVGRRVRPGDVVVGIAASGVTPFVTAALAQAKRRGARAVLVTCARPNSVGPQADVVINPQPGPEIITGSTRLKAGTATKLVLNMLTVASMVQLGKVYGNLMVDVRPTSRKLRARAARIVEKIANVPSSIAGRALRRTGSRTKVAVLLAAQRVTPSEAHRRLAAASDSLRRALESDGNPVSGTQKSRRKR